MARKTKFSVGDAVDVLKAGRSAAEGADAPVCVRVLVDASAPRDLVEAVRDALLPERVGAEVVVGLLGQTPTTSWMSDVCVMACGGSASLVRAAVSQVARRGIPCALVAESAVSVPQLSDLGLPDGVVSTVVASSGRVAVEKLATWLVDATNKDLAFAACFPFCREAEVDRLVSRCALKNAVVGAVDLVPNADMPVMSANQAKLSLEVAAAYGYGLSVSRIPELAGVLAAGFAYRALTRRLVQTAPGVAWLVKGAMGYAGTVATGRALEALHEAEAQGVAPLEVVGEAADGVAHAASSVASGLRGLAERLQGVSGGGLAPLGAMAR